MYPVLAAPLMDGPARNGSAAQGMEPSLHAEDDREGSNLASTRISLDADNVDYAGSSFHSQSQSRGVSIADPGTAGSKEPSREGSKSGSRDLTSLVQELQTALGEKLAEMKDEEAKVESSRRALAEEQAAISALGSSQVAPGDILQLNVGGRLFTTKRSTLMQGEGSVLEGMFSGRWDQAFDKDPEGRIFLDLDPDCFAEVLHQLRLQALSCNSEICWSRVAAPERREAYFRAMLDFLGLAKLPAFSPTFSFFHPSMSRQAEGGGSFVSSKSDGHKWAVGESAMEVGTYMWGFKIHRLKNDHWLFLGVIASQRPGESSFTDPTSYGWACGGESGKCIAFQKGIGMPAHGGWTGFQEGDDVTMQLNVDSGVLRMKVARLQQTVFHFTGLDQEAPWRVHVNLYSADDRVELLSGGQF
eukprot:TRINITY_DN87511_c0_g1_i1.p1 TRINITY_DN87511_c0_g1~~TRINITY_DN87511_c0_g1_i1.p1  ORF type:complete len:415 (-),score=98.72 TRINITY_DN87511_c0_g1_i1:539-1783(-)